MKAFVLLKITSGEVRDACRTLKGLESISESYMTFGRYDAFLVLNADSLEDVRRIVVYELQSIPGVTETLTCIAVENDLKAYQGAW